MAGYEPGAFYVVFFEEFEETADADCACEYTWDDLVGIRLVVRVRGIPRLMSLDESSPP